MWLQDNVREEKRLICIRPLSQSKFKHGAQYIAEDLFATQLTKVFQSIQIPEYAHNEVSEALRAAHEDKKQLRETTMLTLDTEIEKYQRRIEKVYEDYLDEKIPEALYQKKFEEYRKAQKSLQNRRQNTEQIEDDYYATVNHLLDLSKNATKLFLKANNEQKRSLINLVLSNLQLEGDQLRRKTKEPFKTMVLCNENSSWLRQLGSNQRPNR